MRREPVEIDGKLFHPTGRWTVATVLWTPENASDEPPYDPIRLEAVVTIKSVVDDEGRARSFLTMLDVAQAQSLEVGDVGTLSIEMKDIYGHKYKSETRPLGRFRVDRPPVVNQKEQRGFASATVRLAEVNGGAGYQGGSPSRRAKVPVPPLTTPDIHPRRADEFGDAVFGGPPDPNVRVTLGSAPGTSQVGNTFLAGPFGGPLQFDGNLVRDPSGKVVGTTRPLMPGDIPDPSRPAENVVFGTPVPGGDSPYFRTLCAADLPPKSDPEVQRVEVSVDLIEGDPIAELAADSTSHRVFITDDAPGDWRLGKAEAYLLDGKRVEMPEKPPAAERKPWTLDDAVRVLNESEGKPPEA